MYNLLEAIRVAKRSDATTIAMTVIVLVMDKIIAACFFEHPIAGLVFTQEGCDILKSHAVYW